MQIQFDAFRFDTGTRTLWRDEQLVRLPPKAADVLHTLAQRDGALVTKEDLIGEVWPETFVEEANLTVAVSTLRRVLGDAPDGQSYVETIPRRGYRFRAACTSRRTPPRSLAVLPFRPGGPDVASEIGGGIADALIARLSREANLIVRPTTTVLAYGGQDVSIARIGRDLRVDAVLLGSIKRGDADWTATAQLVCVEDEAVSWADSVTMTLDGLPALANRLAENLSSLLAPESRPPAPASAGIPQGRADAYVDYLKGCHSFNQWTGPSLQQAVASFDRVVEKAPDFAMAYARKSTAHLILGFYGLEPRERAWAACRSAAERALALDPRQAEAHVSLGSAFLLQDWRWREAETAFKRAIDLNPRCVSARVWYTIYLDMVGALDEAMRQIQHALLIDPLSLFVNAKHAFQFWLAGRPDESIEICQGILDVAPEYLIGHWSLALALEQKGLYDESLRAYDRTVALSGGSFLMRSVAARGYAAAGHHQEARERLAALTNAPEASEMPYRLAVVHALLGDFEAAFDWLERAFAVRDPWLAWLMAEPLPNAVTRDRRFRSLVERIGFP